MGFFDDLEFDEGFRLGAEGLTVTVESVLALVIELKRELGSFLVIVTREGGTRPCVNFPSIKLEPSTDGNAGTE